MVSEEIIENLKYVLLKPSKTRTYDDILLIKSFLSKTDFFLKHLCQASPRLLDELYRSSFLETYEAGHVIFRQGDHGDKVYIILSGKVEIKSKVDIEIGNSVESRDKSFGILDHGQCFGERALVLTEVRSGTAICVDPICEMISITKDSYLAAVKSAELTDEMLEIEGKDYKRGSKEHVINILNKSRNRRTNEEISIVCTYLENRVPFFLKFDAQQRQELCRVVDIITVRGRYLLFKQGSYGQGFYIVITGTVDVHARNTTDREAFEKTPPRSPAGNQISSITEGLGERVNQLRPGDVFGERALESDHSIRMGSVLTGEDLTQLLVIAKEDFSNLVSIIMHSDIMEKIAVLRKTALFQSVDGLHLRALAKCMYPRLHHIDNILFNTGENIEMMCIISRGELWAEIEVEPKLEEGQKLTKAAVKLNLKGKQHVDLGRIGPYAVLGKGIMLCETVHDQTISTETVIAATLVEYYAVTKIDFLLNLPADSRKALTLAVRSFSNPIIPQLWDDGSKLINDKDWKMKRAWKRYREDMIQDKSSNLLQSYWDMESVYLKTSLSQEIIEDAKQLSQTDLFTNNIQSRGKAPQGTLTLSILSPKSSRANLSANVLSSVGLDWGTPEAIAKERKRRLAKANELYKNIHVKEHKQSHIHYSYDDDKDVLKAIEKGHRRDALRERNRENAALEDIYNRTLSKGVGALLLSPLATYRHNEIPPNEVDPLNPSNLIHASVSSSGLSTFKLYPFTLVQYHRETIGGRGTHSNVNIRRLTRTHIRICGSVSSCHHAKELAHLIMKNSLIHLYQGDISSEDEIALNWRVFHGFDSLPTQSTDHLLIYCKNTPVECASLIPSKSLLTHEYPAACKPQGQRFCCLLSKKIIMNSSDSTESPHNNNESNAPYPSSSSPTKAGENHRFGSLNNKPLLLSEISSIIEIIGVAMNQYDCLRYALLNENEDETIDPNQFADNFDDESISNQTLIQSVFQVGKRLLKNRLQSQSELSLHVFPLFDWIVLDQQTLDMSRSDKTHNIDEKTRIDVKLSKKHLKINDDIQQELQVSLKESGLLQNDENHIAKIFEKFDRPMNYTSNAQSIQMLERQLTRKELSSRISRQYNIATDPENSVSSMFSNGSGSINDNDSMRSYYKKLLAPREDYMQLTRNRLDDLQSLVDARKKILSLNETVCKSENALMTAFHTCSQENIPITAVKFRKIPAHRQIENIDDKSISGMHSLSPRKRLIAIPASTRSELTRSPAMSQSPLSNKSIDEKKIFLTDTLTVASSTMDDLSRSSSPTHIRTSGISSHRKIVPVFNVEEKVLHTIEQSIKGNDATVKEFEKEIGLGLGLIQKRNELNDSLKNFPTLTSIIKQKQIVAKSKEDSRMPQIQLKQQSNLSEKLRFLEAALRDGFIV